ncbi:MAG TPA: peptide chain release factor 3 [Tepidisphaeraceae bacterium]|jgi:peptide chain release factor 3|nr:peptide chain release factor 3 [Tepidisphaeraceae bacterium]
MQINDEIARRRTFAIISHPDAGKTTLTEKFLLYGGAVQLAGSVGARKNQRAATSDWMELERKRGISISSTVLQFDYAGYRINLLDTPGHKDFSEDTYRVLTAVDAVVMVIDAAKGIESQTRKLFEICRRRGVPIFTFMNKLDRPTLEPLVLLDQLEEVLGISAFAMNWPLGTGPAFKGVFERLAKQVHFFERTSAGAYRAPVSIHDLSDPLVREKLSDDVYLNVVEELGMLDAAGASFDQEAVLAGKLTPVFFGSAVNNFGVQLLLDAFLAHSTPPRARVAGETPVNPDDPNFSGFVFKIQANMDPRHRDRIAFVRVCSGKFTRDMAVTHVQSGKRVRLSSSHKLFGQERETIDEAFAGDVIGLVGHAGFGIGDTLTEEPSLIFDEIPRFAPECFAYLHATATSQSKRFREGLEQLLQEGVVQQFQIKDSSQRAPLLAAVGPLQFEVVQYRLESEYGAESRLESASWELLRWVSPETPASTLAELSLPSGAKLAFDAKEQPAILFPSEWSLRYFEKQHPGIRLADVPFKKDGETQRVAVAEV